MLRLPTTDVGGRGSLELIERKNRRFWQRGLTNAPRMESTEYAEEDLDLADGEFNLELPSATHDGVLHLAGRGLAHMNQINRAFWARGGRQ